ncbi:hypothetical protein K440DRAFT_643716 [Wilcoxina mikolae CBS 423.85]|nr:hypothetical protein K440DRAFT_643716 [Wilcoxina mikolae CBS 423.85]
MTAYGSEEEWRDAMSQEYWIRSIFGTEMELECYDEETGWYFDPYGWFDTLEEEQEYKLLLFQLKWGEDEDEECASLDDEDNSFPGWGLQNGSQDYEDDRYDEWYDSDSDDGRYYGYGFR